MNSKEKFLTLVSPANDETVQAIRFRQENKLWLRKSKQIATKALLALKEQGLSQKVFAKKMEVSPQYVSKLLKGNENLTLETLIKMENILNLQLFADLANRNEDNDTYKVSIMST